MPEGEEFWNPYRWVPVTDEKPPRETPAYRHRWDGLSGRLECTLETLTPFFIGSSKGDGRFICSGLTNRPFIPGTSLKGLIRSLAELIGNAAIPFPAGYADANHELGQASQGDGVNWKLDIAARMFGYLHGGRVFAGLVRFSDGIVQENAKAIGPFRVVVGQPRPDHHKPFYPDRKRRKFYHHHFGASELLHGTTQTRDVYPLPPGVCFTFRVDFENLRDDELGLLLYCLVLEEEVSVTLSKNALGPSAKGPVTLTGPLRHKFGGCKPHGGGSVKITIDTMTLCTNMADRYRGGPGAPRSSSISGPDLQDEISRRTKSIASRHDDTMSHLRAMLIYCENDPRKRIQYPPYNWFRHKGTGKPLKPTM